MRIPVEFFGVPRLRTGCARAEIEVLATPPRLGDLLRQLIATFPSLAAECIADDELRDGYVASFSGDIFVRDPGAEIPPGATVLLLATDAGG